jgi:hypothetical protein
MFPVKELPEDATSHQDDHGCDELEQAKRRKEEIG